MLFLWGGSGSHCLPAPFTFTSMRNGSLGFSFVRTADGRVLIRRDGRQVTLLAGARASRFLSRMQDASDARAQLEMAKATGNYRRGNEKRPAR
jgi:hypothetical protein